VLVFVGAKMMLIDVFKIPTAVSLGVIATLIGGSIAVSFWAARRGRAGGRGNARNTASHAGELVGGSAGDVLECVGVA
jgi:predicted tellurium resistance membrane protein TerC